MSYATPEVDTETFAAHRDTGQVVDVREPMEFVAGHVPGAQLIPMGQLASRMSELDKAKPVYVICATGNRSLAMTDLLNRNGFHAASVAGGTRDWAASGRPVDRGRS